MSSDLSTFSKGELITIIFKQAREIEILKETIIELQEKMNQKNSGNDSSKTIPAFVKANIKKKKKVGKRKHRAHGFGRKLDIPTQTILHSFGACPDCGGENLGKPSVCYSRQIIDIPQVQYEVVEHVVFKRYCFNCKIRFYPQIDFSQYVLGKGRIGINLMAAIFAMREEENLSVNQIQSHLKTFYQLDLSLGEIVKILHQEADLSQTEYQNIKQNLLNSKVIYADETGGRENGVNGYHWSFSNQKFHLLTYNQSRGAKVVKAVLGEEGKDFEGVLVTDFYSSYNEYLGPHQRCWVHYLRDLNKLKEDNPKDRKLKLWINKIHKLYEEAKFYSGPEPNLLPGLKEQERIVKEQYFKQKLKIFCEPFIKTILPQAKLSARALRFLPEMFTFIRFEGVNSDNNMAERAVRKTVIKRKISFGTRSKKGSETRSILGSLFGTWRLQNLNPFEQMKLLLLNSSRQGV
jgi:transposase